jgi:LysM repeat protein
MNRTSKLNSELLSADARGRKHIPLAVFAVIMIHVLLFVVLLIAAGCRAKLRARQAAPPAELAQEQTASPSASPRSEALAISPAGEAVVAAEPLIETDPVIQSVAQREPQRLAVQTVRAGTAARPRPLVYTVRAGDTVEKIARRYGTTIHHIRTANRLKNDLIHPGQKLQVSKPQQKQINEV